MTNIVQHAWPVKRREKEKQIETKRELAFFVIPSGPKEGALNPKPKT